MKANYVVEKPAIINVRLTELAKNVAELAEVIGCAHSCARNYVSGARIPPANVLPRIAKYYGVTTDYLLGLTNDREETSSTEHGGIDKDLYAVLGLFFAAYTGLPEDVVNLLIDNKKAAPKTAAILRSLLTEV